MSRIAPKWRRLWGIRPDVLLRRPEMIGHGPQQLGRPKSGPHGRGFLKRFRADARRRAGRR